MRFDPRRRLDRPLPGARVTEERALRLHLGEERPERAVPVPPRDQQALRTVTTRASRQRVNAGPNAPQLIRLIRHPYALATTRPARRVVIEPRAEIEGRPPLGHPMREAVEARGTLASSRDAVAALMDRPRAFAPRTSAVQVVPPLSGSERAR